MTVEFCTELHDRCDRIRDISIALENLSAGFARTGNEAVSRTLDKASMQLYEHQDKLRSAYGAEVAHEVREAEKSAANTMLAALAGITIAQKAPT